MINFTVLNSMGVYGRITEIKWVENVINNEDKNDSIRFQHDNLTDNLSNNSINNNNSSYDFKKSKSWSKVTFASENSIGTISSSWGTFFEKQIKRELKTNNNNDQQIYDEKIKNKDENKTENETKNDIRIKNKNKNASKQKVQKKQKSGGNKEDMEETIDDGRTITLIGKVLTLRIQLNQIVYPFSGYLAVSITVTNHMKNDVKNNEMKKNDNSNTGNENENENEDSRRSRVRNGQEKKRFLHADIANFIGEVNGRLLVTVETPGKSLFAPELSFSDINHMEKKRNDDNSNNSDSRFSSNSRDINNSSSSSSSRGRNRILVDSFSINDNSTNNRKKNDYNYSSNSNPDYTNVNISINVAIDHQNNSSSNNNRNFNPYILHNTLDEDKRKHKRENKEKFEPRSSLYNPVGNVHVSVASADIIIRIEETPPRAKRLLWDVYHDIGYPSAYVPRDDLSSSRCVPYLLSQFNSQPASQSVN